jgi:hypothetical protein
MYPRRVLPPRRELSPQMRELIAEAMARRGRVESAQDRAAFTVALETYLAQATGPQLRAAAATNFFHLGVYRPNE